jgi:hypothetical protein
MFGVSILLLLIFVVSLFCVDTHTHNLTIYNNIRLTGIWRWDRPT